MLTILLASCETALRVFTAADTRVDGRLVEDLETLVARTRQELEALTKRTL